MLDNISRQLKRETEAHVHAVDQLQRKYLDANSKSYGSSTVVGQAAQRHFLRPIAEKVAERMFVLRRGQAAVDAETVYRRLKDADPEVLALLALKVCLDVLGKNQEPSLQDLCVPIGMAVQTQLRLDFYFQENPDLYNKVEYYFHSGTGTRQKATVFKRAFNQASVEWPTWPNDVNHKVGGWLLDCIVSVTGWITKVTIQRGRRAVTLMRYDRSFLEMRDTILAKAEQMSFALWPMLCPPVSWSNTERGGYLTETIRNAHPLVRRQWALGEVLQGDIPIQFLNNLQGVGYRINPVVLAVAEHCYENDLTVGKFKRMKYRQPPVLEIEQPTDEELLSFKRACREAHDHNAQISQKNWRTTETMWVARKYRDEEAFWVPWSFCYRGRVYPLVSALSPQGTDFDKSLFLFAEAGPVNAYWLAFAVSNTYGNDKLPMDERIAWTEQNHALIQAIGEDPIGTIPEWENVAEPWSFMAACVEYTECVLKCSRSTSGLPVGIDATQSGIQHLSAMTLDAGAAALVNVTPADKPQDGYRTVAEHAAKLLDQPYASWMNRKVTKRTCMCTPYGVKRQSARDYIRDALRADGRDLKEPGVLKKIVDVIFNESIPAVFPGPVACMNWLQSCAREVMQYSDRISWTTPSGFVVSQDLRKPRGKLVKTRLMGSVIQATVALSPGDPDKDHHRNALAPNFVHSADASLLHLAFAYWDKPFTVIHDCVLGRSCDIRQMGEDIRLHFAEMYKAPVLQDWANQVGVEIPDDLIKNTLDVELVHQSDYFFC